MSACGGHTSENSMLALSLAFIVILAAWDVVPLLRGDSAHHHYAVSLGALFGLLLTHEVCVGALLWSACAAEAHTSCRATRNAREFAQLQAVTTGAVAALAAGAWLVPNAVLTHALVATALVFVALANTCWFLYIHLPAGAEAAAVRRAAL